MIKAADWRNLQARHVSLNEAWDALKRARASGDPKAESRAVMRYLQAVQQIYEASQSAVSLHS